MNKKGKKKKVLKNFNNGYKIIEVRDIKEEVIFGKQSLKAESSYIALFFGKRLIKDKFKNVKEATTHYTNECRK